MRKNIELSANGKLLLAGEYLVLAGAEALSFPVRFGQKLKVKPARQKFIHWVSIERGYPWFICDFNPVSLQIVYASDPEVAHRLMKLLNAAKLINPGFLNREAGYNVTVDANYPLNWGMGSSSTLTALVAAWAEVDPFRLYRSVSEGSGYDIASAMINDLFFYRLEERLPVTRPCSPGKALQENSCFAFLGKKQESSSEVSAFLSGKNYSDRDVERISQLSAEICTADDPSRLCSLLDEHEEIISRILNKDRISDNFGDFPGSVKSLGAWGGDFAMFCSAMTSSEIKEFLINEGFRDVFTFDELKIK